MSNKLKTIPLCQLRPSRANVRKTDRRTDIGQLAASIEANGLLENLVVRPVANGGEPAFEVVAGGRRLAALKLLAKGKKIDRDQPVACLVLTSAAESLEVSLAENFVRMPVHPADQFEAFAGLSSKGLSTADIASRFGITRIFVEQRLKLAGVSPRLVAEFRKGAMSLDQLTAFTLCDDRGVQEEVWFERSRPDISPSQLRQLLTRTEVSSADCRARFIGAKAYEAAGGIIKRDLFDTANEGYYCDSQLLDRLVAEKLNETAQTISGEGWLWVEVHADLDEFPLHRFGRAKVEEQALSTTDQQRLSALGARYDELVATLEEEGGGASDELDRISAEITVLEESQVNWPSEEKAHSGTIVCLGADGDVAIYRGLIKPTKDQSSNVSKRRTEKEKRATNGYSDSVLLDLSAHRTAALRAVVAQKPDVALVALLHALVQELFYDDGCESCLAIVASDLPLDKASQTVASSPAVRSLETVHARWAEQLQDRSQLWAFLQSLSETERLALLAHCVAMTVNALDTSGTGAARSSRDLAAIVGLDMKDWWQPTRDNFIGRLTKNEILATVSEAVSAQSSWRLAPLKKDRMAKEAEKLLVSSSWLPPCFRRDQIASDEQTV